MNKIKLPTIKSHQNPHAPDVELKPKEILCNDVILPWERHYHGMHLWIIGNEYGTLAAAWASNEQDALDIACDADLLGGPSASEEPDDEEEREQWEEHIARLGDAGEPHDLTYLWMTKADLVRCSPEILCLFAEARGAGHDTLEPLT